MPKPSLFGRRLADARRLRGLTQEQLAERANVPAAVISHFETGVRASASADNLVKLADALQVSVDYLLGRTDETAPVASDLEKRAAGLTTENWEVLATLTDALAKRSAKGRG
jgi:transcriptional regulator with XRE-family HTH domain